MSGPNNRHYIVAVNQTGTYPLEKSSHMKDGELHPEVQRGYLTTANVIPDGQVIPETSNSLYLGGWFWSDIQNITWGEVHDTFLW